MGLLDLRDDAPVVVAFLDPTGSSRVMGRPEAAAN
jgi:hypothetical protein